MAYPPEANPKGSRERSDAPPTRRRQGAMAGSALCLPPCPKRLPLLFPKISLRCDFREPCNNPLRGFGGFPIYQKRRHPCGCRRFCMPAGSDHIRVRADVGSRARAAIGRDALPRLPKGNGNSAQPDLYLVTLTSSSLAYAVSILPKGKMHDLQGGSSSSQKSRFAAIFGSPVFEPRSRTGLACCVSVTDAFAVFGTFFAFCTRSLRSLRSVGMTGGGV